MINLFFCRGRVLFRGGGGSFRGLVNLLIIIIIIINLLAEEEYFFEVAEAVFVGWFTFLK
jgi:hypothetical protein